MYIDDPIDDEFTKEKWDAILKNAPALREYNVTVTIMPNLANKSWGVKYSYSHVKDGMSIYGCGTPYWIGDFQEALDCATDLLRMAGPKEG